MQAMTLAPSGTASLAQRLKPLLDPLFAFAFTRSRVREMALDAVQESMRAALQAAREGKTWADDELLWAWLCTVARNKLADEWRRQSRRGPTLTSLGMHGAEISPALLEGAELPPQVASRSEVATLCRAALSELPPRQRVALESFYHSGRSHAQIAQELEISPKAAESLLARGRDALQAVLRRMVAKPEELL